MTVRAVAVSRREVVWTAERALDPTQALTEELTVVLRALPARFARRVPVVVALGPSCTQLKRLVGLPSTLAPSAMTAAVRESATRFFLRNGTPIITSATRVDRSRDGASTWAAAADAPVLTAVFDAARAARVHIEAVVPTACVLASAVAEREASDALTIDWADGSCSVQGIFSSGRLTAITRRVGAAAPSITRRPDIHPALARAGDDPWRFAGAYGAAVQGRHEVIAWRPDTLAGCSHGVRWSMVLAGVTCAIAIALGATAPIVAARHIESTARNGLLALDPARAAAASDGQNLRRVTDALREIDTFWGSRRSVGALMAAVTRAMPPRSALVAVHIDSASTLLVVLTPSAADFVSALHDAGVGVNVEIVGPLTREILRQAGASEELERVTVRVR